MPAGRPREYDREALAVEFEKYISETEIPIVAEFSAKHWITKDLVYDWPEFSSLIKSCTFKKEAALERQMLKNKINVTAAIFSLKQLGWSDKQEHKHSGALNLTPGDERV